ncbi:MAG TPA: lamin tail domain-containing protein [Leptolinea sp.]
MNPWKRLLFYLVLNAIVSAIATLTVLSVWDRNHRLNVQPVAQLAATVTQQAANNLALSTPSPIGSSSSIKTPPQLTPAGNGDVQIENVFGVGVLDTEVVLLKRSGDGELWVTGWRLEDENNHRYVFPELMLNKDGAIKVFTKTGTNSVVELHWGLKEPVWSTGELVSLLDQNGTVRATYRIP